MHKKIVSILLFLFIVVSSVGGQVYTVEQIRLQYCDLTNLYRIDSAIYRSDQPSPKDFKALEKFGITDILNLRCFNDDTDEAEGTNLSLYHVPMFAFAMSEKQLIECLRIIQNRKGPLLVHCYHGSDRTGAVIALYRMVFQGVPKELAIEEMKGKPFGHHTIFVNITHLLKRIDVAAVRKELGLPDEIK